MKRGAALLLVCVGCQAPSPSYRVVHHSANGCEPGAPENSLAGMRCIAAGCKDGTAPCAVERDARIVRLLGGSLGDDLEIIWAHDASSARTARCPTGPVDFPGSAPIGRERFEACKLTRFDGTTTDEPIPTLDQVVSALEGAPVHLTLELKPVGDDGALDQRLIAGTLAKLTPALRALTVVTSFELATLAAWKRAAPDVPTGCYVPSGHGAAQIARYLREGALTDVDTCLRAGHEWVYVPPAVIDGSLVAHVKHAHARLGAWGVNAEDAVATVKAWGDRIDAVETDHPSIFGWQR